MELNFDTAIWSKQYRHWKYVRIYLLAIGIMFMIFLSVSNLMNPLRRSDKSSVSFIADQLLSSDLLTTTITDIENIQSCGLGKQVISLIIPPEAKNNIVISINSSNMTSHRLCPLIASIHAQAKFLKISVHITVFADEIIPQSTLCGKAHVMVWEPMNQHERYFTRVKPLWTLYEDHLDTASWIFLIDDDTVVFLAGVLHHIQSLDPQLPHLLGTVSASSYSIHHLGTFPYGGGGILLSKATLASMQEILPCCQVQYATLYGGDEKLSRCVQDIGIPFQPVSAFHQMDIRGDLSGYIEGVVSRSLPVATWHHIDIPESSLLPHLSAPFALSSLFVSYHSILSKSTAAWSWLESTFWYGTLTQEEDAVVVSSYPLTFQYTVGYSLILYIGHVRYSDIQSRVEKTFDTWTRQDITPYAVRPRLSFLPSSTVSSTYFSTSLRSSASSASAHSDSPHTSTTTSRSKENSIGKTGREGDDIDLDLDLEHVRVQEHVPVTVPVSTKEYDSWYEQKKGKKVMANKFFFHCLDTLCYHLSNHFYPCHFPLSSTSSSTSPTSTSTSATTTTAAHTKDISMDQLVYRICTNASYHTEYLEILTEVTVHVYREHSDMSYEDNHIVGTEETRKGNERMVRIEQIERVMIDLSCAKPSSTMPIPFQYQYTPSLSSGSNHTLPTNSLLHDASQRISSTSFPTAQAKNHCIKILFSP